jgi:hypothetical protein
MATVRIIVQVGMAVGRNIKFNGFPMPEGSTVEDLQNEMLTLKTFSNLWKQKGVELTADRYQCYIGDALLDPSTVLANDQKIVVKWQPKTVPKEVPKRKVPQDVEEDEQPIVPRSAASSRRRSGTDDEWMMTGIKNNKQYELAEKKLVAWRQEQSRLRAAGKLVRLQEIDKMYAAVLEKVREYRPTYKASVGDQFKGEADAFTAKTLKDLNKIASAVVGFANRSAEVVRAMEDPDAAPLVLKDAAPSQADQPALGFPFDAAEWAEFQAFKKWKASQAKREQEE